ncbi:uncharacterized protein LOC111312582 isoform X2 [Durio zibethinus]|uniref:Uncharacterized protein LOC111312582 isoform X2 n=1 Tax=Durio zibethinus TaxID=66656 RepID=A0A6P6AUX6_DURZI|nr:uncharacterized protein LOC111312582 isoform X2 [Durio zibethinus]
MAAPLLLKGIPLLRLRLPRYNRLTVGIISAPRRPWCVAADSAGQEEEASSVEKSSAVLSVRDPPKYHRWDDPDYRKWKDKEEEILRDIEPIISLAKEILHSDRYMDGERLTVADEETVVEKLLRHHPHSEDKIGCGLDSIMWHQFVKSLRMVVEIFVYVWMIIDLKDPEKGFLLQCYMLSRMKFT